MKIQIFSFIELRELRVLLPASFVFTVKNVIRKRQDYFHFGHNMEPTESGSNNISNLKKPIKTLKLWKNHKIEIFTFFSLYMVSLILFFEFIIHFSEISWNHYALRAESSSQSIIKALTENMAVLPKITTINYSSYFTEYCHVYR